MEYNQIFIAVDGSKEAELALKKAIAISKRNNMAKVHVIHVVDKSGRMHFAEQVDNMISFELQKFGETLFARYEQTLQKVGVPNELNLLEGVPKQELLHLFKQLEETDLVICGATGIHHGSLERLLVGSVSDNIVRLSN